jgi:hypothetical protein
LRPEHAPDFARPRPGSATGPRPGDGRRSV